MKSLMFLIYNIHISLQNEMLAEHVWVLYMYTLTLSDREGGPLVLGVVVSAHWWGTLPPYKPESTRLIVPPGTWDSSPPVSVCRRENREKEISFIH
jgi:hypothetical protein